MIEAAPGVFVFTSSAFALNSGVIAGTPGGSGRTVQGRVARVPERSAREAMGASATFAPAVLIDPGYFPAELDRIASFLEGRGLAASRIVLTHSDWDHVVGPGRFPEAAVVASSEFPPRVERDRGAIVGSLAETDARLYVARSPAFSIPEPATLAGSPTDLVWPGPALRLMPAGGHTADGLMVLLRQHRVLFAGDHLSDLEIPFVGDSIAAYHATLAMVRSLVARGEIEVLVPGHGAVCGRGGIDERLDEDEDYLSRLTAWVRDTRRTVKTRESILDRCDEVVFGKGWDNPFIRREHRANVAKALDQEPSPSPSTSSS